MTIFTALLIGDPNDPRRARLETELRDRTKGPLKTSGETLSVCDQMAVPAPLPEKGCVAVVFCRKPMDADTEIAAIKACVMRGTPIIPVVKDLTQFGAASPDEVSEFNGFQLADDQDIAELAGLVLEMIGLQRAKRKVFISYARQDTSAIAEQLRLAFTARWYTVFLDTISIRPGVLFQNALKEELADSDVVVFLNSKNAKDRHFVKEEIKFVDNAGIGGLQVTWPDPVKPLPEGSLLMPLQLKPEEIETVKADDNNAGASKDTGSLTRLTPAAVLRILRKVAEIRTAAQQQREDEVFAPIKAYAKQKGWSAVSYLGRHIELREGHEGEGDGRVRLDIALGVPTSRDIERAFTNASPKPPAGRLVYSLIGITDAQSEHLKFFGKALKLDLLDPGTALDWTVI